MRNSRQQGEGNPSSRSSSLESESGDEFQPGAPQTVTVATQAEGKNKDILDELIEQFEVGYQRNVDFTETEISKEMVFELEKKEVKDLVNGYRQEYERMKKNDSFTEGQSSDYHKDKLKAMRDAMEQSLFRVRENVVTNRTKQKYSSEGSVLSVCDVEDHCWRIAKEFEKAIRMQRRPSSNVVRFWKSDSVKNMQKHVKRIEQEYRRKTQGKTLKINV